MDSCSTCCYYLLKKNHPCYLHNRPESAPLPPFFLTSISLWHNEGYWIDLWEINNINVHHDHEDGAGDLWFGAGLLWSSSSEAAAFKIKVLRSKTTRREAKVKLVKVGGERQGGRERSRVKSPQDNNIIRGLEQSKCEMVTSVRNLKLSN